MISKATNQQYLLTEQYHDASNLNVRAQLHARFNTNPYSWHRWVFDQFELAASSRILEIGCGPGYLWRENLDRLPKDWWITLSDFSEGMLAQTKQHLGNQPTFSFEHFDAQAIPFEAEQFDAVIANHMLYHVPDRVKTYAEVQRVLKSNGRLYAATNGKHHLAELRILMQTVSAKFGQQGEKSLFERFTLENGLAELNASFPEVSLRYYESDLEVTDVEPLVAYAQSTITLQASESDQLRKIAGQEIAAQGAFHITKSSGLFIAC